MLAHLLLNPRETVCHEKHRHFHVDSYVYVVVTSGFHFRVGSCSPCQFMHDTNSKEGDGYSLVQP